MTLFDIELFAPSIARQLRSGRQPLGGWDNLFPPIYPPPLPVLDYQSLAYNHYIYGKIAAGISIALSFTAFLSFRDVRREFQRFNV